MSLYKQCRGGVGLPLPCTDAAASAHVAARDRVAVAVRIRARLVRDAGRVYAARHTDVCCKAGTRVDDCHGSNQSENPKDVLSQNSSLVVSRAIGMIARLIGYHTV